MPSFILVVIIVANISVPIRFSPVIKVMDIFILPRPMKDLTELPQCKISRFLCPGMAQIFLLILIPFLSFSSNTSLNLAEYVFSLSLAFFVNNIYHGHQLASIQLLLLLLLHRSTKNGLDIFTSPSPRYMGNTEDRFQEQTQQQLTRSFSLDIPMELRRAHFSLPAINDLRPRERFSLNHPRIKADASNRLSLNAKARPSSAQHRQVRAD